MNELFKYIDVSKINWKEAAMSGLAMFGLGLSASVVHQTMQRETATQKFARCFPLLIVCIEDNEHVAASLLEILYRFSLPNAESQVMEELRGKKDGPEFVHEEEKLRWERLCAIMNIIMARRREFKLSLIRLTREEYNRCIAMGKETIDLVEDLADLFAALYPDCEYKDELQKALDNVKNIYSKMLLEMSPV